MDDYWDPDFELRPERPLLAVGDPWHNNGRPVLPVESIAEQARLAKHLACSVMGPHWYLDRPVVRYCITT